MPRYIVRAQDLIACYSTVVEDFITPFMDLDSFEKWRDAEYGPNKKPLSRVYEIPLNEAIFELSLNKPDSDIMESMRQAGLFYDPKEEEH